LHLIQGDHQNPTHLLHTLQYIFLVLGSASPSAYPLPVSNNPVPIRGNQIKSSLLLLLHQGGGSDIAIKYVHHGAAALHTSADQDGFHCF